jgi:hypothetical protein
MSEQEGTIKEWQNEQLLMNRVTAIIGDAGEISSKKLQMRIHARFGTIVPVEEIEESLSQLEAKDIVTRRMYGKSVKFALRDNPFPPKSKMTHIVGSLNPEADKVVEDAEEIEESEVKRSPQGKYRNYKMFTLTCKTIDPIAGGDPCGKQKMILPRGQDGKPTFRRNWMYGWLRDNGRLVNLPVHIQGWVAFGDPIFPNEVNPVEIEGRTLKGYAVYECIPRDTIFQITIKYPMSGTKIRTSEELREKLNEMSMMPMRGLGANARFFGGRFAVEKIEET